jgi:hypothetical protein
VKSLRANAFPATELSHHDHMFRLLLVSELSIDAAALAHVDNILSYRLQLSNMATELLDAAGIPRPQGKTRNQFNVDRFET